MDPENTDESSVVSVQTPEGTELENMDGTKPADNCVDVGVSEHTERNLQEKSDKEEETIMNTGTERRETTNEPMIPQAGKVSSVVEDKEFMETEATNVTASMDSLQQGAAMPGETIPIVDEADITDKKAADDKNTAGQDVINSQSPKEDADEIAVVVKEAEGEEPTKSIQLNGNNDVIVVEEHEGPSKPVGQDDDDVIVVEALGTGGGLMGYRDKSEVVVVGDTSDSSPDSSSDEEETKPAEPAETTDASINRVMSSERDQSPDRNKKVKMNRFGFEDVRTKGELMPEELPPMEELTITVDESVVMIEVGKIKSILGVLVVIQSVDTVKPLDEETILFLDGHKVLGQVFEVFGPVKTPWYSVRFNNAENISGKGLHVGQKVYCAPTEEAFTKFVFVNHLQHVRGSDASWEDNNEPPEKYLDYSDDESEKRAKAKGRRKKGRGAQTEGQVNGSEDGNQGNKRTRNGAPNEETRESSSNHQQDRRNPFQLPHSSSNNQGPRFGQFQGRPQNSAPRAQRWPPHNVQGTRGDFPRHSSQRFGGPPDFRGANNTMFPSNPGQNLGQGDQGQQQFTNRPFFAGGNFSNDNSSLPGPFTNGNLLRPTGQPNQTGNGMFMPKAVPGSQFGQQELGFGSQISVPVPIPQDFSRPPPPLPPANFTNTSQMGPPGLQTPGFQASPIRQGLSPGPNGSHQPLASTVVRNQVAQPQSQHQVMWPVHAISSGVNTMIQGPAGQPVQPIFTMNHQVGQSPNNVPAYLQSVCQSPRVTQAKHNAQTQCGAENSKKGMNVHGLNPAMPSHYTLPGTAPKSVQSQGFMTQQTANVNLMYQGLQNNAAAGVQNSGHSNFNPNTTKTVPMQSPHMQGMGNNSGQIPSIFNTVGLPSVSPGFNNNMPGGGSGNQQFPLGLPPQRMVNGSHVNNFQGNQHAGPLVDHRFIQNPANQ